MRCHGVLQLLLGAKTLANLSLSEIVAPRVVEWPEFPAVWTRLATHSKLAARNTAASVIATLLSFQDSRRMLVVPFLADSRHATNVAVATRRAGAGGNAGAGGADGEAPVGTSGVTRRQEDLAAILGVCAASPLASDTGDGADALRGAIARMCTAMSAQDMAARLASAAALVPVPIVLPGSQEADVASCDAGLRARIRGLYTDVATMHAARTDDDVAQNEASTQLQRGMKLFTETIEAHHVAGSDDPGIVAQGNTVAHIMYGRVLCCCWQWCRVLVAFLTPVCGRYIVKSVAAMHPSDALLTYTLRMLTTAALGKRASTKFIDAGAFDVAQALLLRVREACSVPTPSHHLLSLTCVCGCACVCCVWLWALQPSCSVTTRRLLARVCFNLTWYGERVCCRARACYGLTTCMQLRQLCSYAEAWHACLHCGSGA